MKFAASSFMEYAHHWQRAERASDNTQRVAIALVIHDVAMFDPRPSCECDTSHFLCDAAHGLSPGKR